MQAISPRLRHETPSVAHQAAGAEEAERSGPPLGVEIDLGGEVLPVVDAALEDPGEAVHGVEEPAGIARGGERAALEVGDYDHGAQGFRQQIGHGLEGARAEGFSQAGRVVATGHRGHRRAAAQEVVDLVFREAPLPAHLHGGEPAVLGHPIDRGTVDLHEALDVLGGQECHGRSDPVGRLHLLHHYAS